MGPKGTRSPTCHQHNSRVSSPSTTFVMHGYEMSAEIRASVISL